MSAVCDSTVKERATQTAFVPPAVEAGDAVFWYSPGHSERAIGIVQWTNGDGSVCLSIIPNPAGPIARGWIDQEKQVVHHVDDPARPERTRMYGSWDLTDGEKQRRAKQAELEHTLSELSEIVDCLTGANTLANAKAAPKKTKET